MDDSVLELPRVQARIGDVQIDDRRIVSGVRAGSKGQALRVSELEGGKIERCHDLSRCSEFVHFLFGSI